MAVEPQVAPRALEDFQRQAQSEALEPLWLQRNLFSGEPTTPVRPYVWRWELVRRRLLEAAALVPLGQEGADRRVLALKNPGVERGIATTQTLAVAYQLVHAGEKAPTHRHSPAAIRFVIEGQATWTLVDDEPCSMEPGDLILTPNWTWHGHVNESEGPMIWLDALDAPLIFALNQMFYEESAVREPTASRSRDDSLRRYGTGSLLPTWERPTAPYSPLLSYKWAETEARLRQFRPDEGSPFDGVVLAYTNPFTGGPVLPTLACHAQLLRPGERTRAHRHTASAVYHVVRGRGATIVNGERHAWERGDTLALPTWAWHEHENASASEDAILFSVSDQPVLQALGLSREQPYDAPDGHQPA